MEIDYTNYDEMETGKIYTFEYLGDATLIVPKEEYLRDEDDFYGVEDVVWHIDLTGMRRVEPIAPMPACGYEDEGRWLECTRIAPVRVCPECLRIEAEQNGTN